MKRFVPHPNTAGPAEQLRGAAGALVGLMVAGAIASLWNPGYPGMALLAPMAASAVLMFCLPASPMAQPWPVLGGSVIAAILGVACARAFPEPLVAAPLAVALSLLAMFPLRCLHPPGASFGMLAVLGGPELAAQGYDFAFGTVGFDMLLLVLAALIYNNATGRRYPHLYLPAQAAVRAPPSEAPTARLGFSPEDLDHVLRRYGQVLDVSRDDLEALILQTEMHAFTRRFGMVTCGDIMAPRAVAVDAGTTAGDAWRKLQRYQAHSLPVVDSDGGVQGIVSRSDFLRGLDMGGLSMLREALARLLRRGVASRRVESIMRQPAVTAPIDMPAVELVPLMANGGYHDIPVVDTAGRFAGMVSQPDLIAALYRARLYEAAASQG